MLKFEDAVAIYQLLVCEWEPSVHGQRHGTVWLTVPHFGYVGIAVYHDADNGGYHLGSTIEFRNEATRQEVHRNILAKLFKHFPQARVPRDEP